MPNMNVVINTTELSYALSCVRSVINTRMNGAFAGVQLRAKDGRLEVLASDGQAYVRTYANCTVLEEGEVVAPVMLIELVGKLSGSETQLTLEGSTIKVSNKNGGKGKASKSSLALIPGELNFPEKEDGDLAVVSMKAEDLLSAANAVAYAVSRDETRLILTGVGAEVENGHLLLTACDGFRMSHVSVETESASTPGGAKFSAVLSQRFLALLTKLVKEGKVELTLSSGSAIMNSDNVSVVCPMLSGAYIDYHRMIDMGERKIRATVKKDALMSAINCASIIENKEKLITLVFDGTTLNLSARSNIAETVSEIESACEGIDGESFRISVNGAYFADIVKAVKGEEVRIEMGTPVSPIFVGASENHIAMVLPVRTADNAMSA